MIQTRNTDKLPPEVDKYRKPQLTITNYGIFPEADKLISIAEDFSRRVWEHRERIKLEDVMLFGSLVHQRKSPKDIDILILHGNEIFDRFEGEFPRESQEQDIKKYSRLIDLFAEKGVDLQQILGGSPALNLIGQNRLNAIYMNTRFFQDSEYRADWERRNCWNPDFFKKIFSYGLLWDGSAGNFRIPAGQKYPTTFKQQQNQS